MGTIQILQVTAFYILLQAASMLLSDQYEWEKQARMDVLPLRFLVYAGN